jgi:organic radical activating enzyme
MATINHGEKDQMLKVAEIFKSIQGEGPYQGTEQVFIRLFGCNLRCRYCDTPLDSYKEMSVEDVVDEVSKHSGYHSISITGGEPLVQIRALKKLIKALKKRKDKVYLETNGTLYQELKSVIDSVDIIAMDFKLPSVIECGRHWDRHRRFLEIAKKKEVFVKAIIGPSLDWFDLRMTVEMIKAIAPKIQLILQPQHPYTEALKNQMSFYKNFCMKEGVETKILSQMHKELGVQ